MRLKLGVLRYIYLPFREVKTLLKYSLLEPEICLFEVTNVLNLPNSDDHIPKSIGVTSNNHF